MAYVNKGSTISSITVAQDGTGNFNCNGVDDQVQIALALARANATGADSVHFKTGTYDINNLTIANNVEIVADEEDVVWSLPAAPSLTTTAIVTFRGITLRSTLDGSGHVFLGGDTYFRFCDFDLQLDSEDGILSGIIRSNAASTNRIEFLNCTLIGGEDGAEFFVFFQTVTDMDELVVKDFLISSLTANDVTNGRFAIFAIPSGDSLTYFEADNIEVKGLNATSAGNCLLYVATGASVSRIEMDGLMFHDGNTWTNNDSSFNPLMIFDSGVSTPTVGDIVISNWKLYGRAHPQVHGASYLEVDNMELVSPAVIALGHFNAFDCAVTDSYPCYASFNNITVVDGGITMNDGWRNFKVSNSTFISSRIAVLEEVGGQTGQERFVDISNCFWRYETDGKYDYAFLLSYSQGNMSLNYLQVTNTTFNRVYTVFSVETPQNPTHIILDNIVVYPTISSTNPKLFTPAGRDNDNQIVWIFNSDIATDSPPFASWNPLRTNDRLDSVRFNDNGTLTYSENNGKATIANGTASIPVNHFLAGNPDTFGCILLTGAENHLEASQVVAHTPGTAQFTIQFVGGGNVTADRDIYWRARLTP